MSERDAVNTPVTATLPESSVARLDSHALNRRGIRKNPGDFAISLRSRFGTDQQLHHPGARRQPMRGFEDHYADIVDYIVRSTHRAWEERDIGYVYDFYSHACVVRDEGGMVFGRDRVIENSIGLMAAFPDMRWLPGEVIWSGDDEVGFHTSHRGLFVGTNTGWSTFGPPTGKRCQFWAMANCVVIANEIVEEWVIENTATLAQQLGLDVRAIAAATAPDPAARFGGGEPARLLGQGKPARMPPHEGPFDPEDLIRRMLHTVWNWRLVGMAAEFMASNVRAFGPSGRTIVGLGDYQAQVLARLAMFPDLALSVDDLYWMGNEAEGFMVAVRWTMAGTHRGHGIYGPPTGRAVRLWGISHFDIRGGCVVEEWTMFNEFSVMRQIYVAEFA